MEVAEEELDNQQVVRSAEAHVLASEKESFHDSVERTIAASNPIANREYIKECVMDKEKEKVDEKIKELVFIEGIELVDLDNYNVTDRKLQCDSTNSDDDNSSNADSIGVCDGHGLYSQTMDSNDY